MLIPARKTPPLERAFLLYTRRYLRRSFHTIHLLGNTPVFHDDGHTPLLICMNHSSWWDVLIGLIIAEDVFDWEWYAVMDARQLMRYRMFSYMGMIGVDRTGLNGAKEFLAYCRELLPGRRRALWLTPQGEMLSTSTRPLRFQPGLGHLASQIGPFHLCRVAVHYEFWNERWPEAFVSLSTPEFYREVTDRKAFVCAQEQALEAQVDALLAAAQTRDASRFQPLLRGNVGISPVFDASRALLARLRGQKFVPGHGDVITPPWKPKGE